ncbi:hypothetical protein MHM582_3060 [Microbacterium sp. HM58-2]|nr:hypothetical protein MHM582_3060 [Microbacterium sp. HM58-2]
MDLQTVMLGVIVALLLAVGGLILWSVRRGRRWKETQTATADAHRAEIDAHTLEHDKQVSVLQTEKQATDALRARAVSAAAQGMRWELASRHQLVRACEAAGIDAVIATNVVFTPAEPAAHPFCAQIDHLVITGNAVLVVESKRWDGVVFDGIRPSTHAAAFAALFDDADLAAPFAVQLTRPNADSPTIESRFSTDKRAPALQARRQAMRLHELLRRRSGAVPFIDTCVFYSHPHAQVFAHDYDGEGKARTAIATSESIRRVITDVHESKTTGLTRAQATLVIDTIRELGADLVGTGRFAAEYQSAVPLEHSVPDDKATTR